MSKNRKSRAAALSVGSNSLLIVLKLLAGFFTGSVSILAEALHSTLDLFAAIIAFFAVRAADKPPDKKHPFGHGKIENLSGAIEALLIFVAAALIIWESIKKIPSGTGLESLEIGLVIMGVSILVNIAVSRYLLKVARETDSIALEADARHLTTDVWTSVSVFVGLGIVRLTGIEILDPIVALIVALLIIKAAYDVLRKSLKGLVDEKLPPEEEAKIIECINKQKVGLVSFHELRTRKSGSWRFIDLHIIVPKEESIEDAHEVCNKLEDELKKELPRSSVTVHAEPCDGNCSKCNAECKFRS